MNIVFCLQYITNILVHFHQLRRTIKNYKKMLEKKADLLSKEHRALFGEKFKNYVRDTVKTRQRPAEIFRGMSKGKSLQPFQQKQAVESAKLGSPANLRFQETNINPCQACQVKCSREEAPLCNMLPDLVSLNPTKVHPVVRGLLSIEILPKLKLTRKM